MLAMVTTRLATFIYLPFWKTWEAFFNILLGYC